MCPCERIRAHVLVPTHGGLECVRNITNSVRSSSLQVFAPATAYRFSMPIVRRVNAVVSRVCRLDKCCVDKSQTRITSTRLRWLTKRVTRCVAMVNKRFRQVLESYDEFHTWVRVVLRSRAVSKRTACGGTETQEQQDESPGARCSSCAESQSRACALQCAIELACRVTKYDDERARRSGAI